MELVSYGKGSPSKVQGGGVYIGTITRIDGDMAYVQLPKLTGRAVYGPCPTALGAGSMAVGDTVFCAFVGHQWDQLVVLACTSPIDLEAGYSIDGGSA